MNTRRRFAVVMLLSAGLLAFLLTNIVHLLVSRHDTAVRCRAEGYTWIGHPVNKCLDAREVHP